MAQRSRAGACAVPAGLNSRNSCVSRTIAGGPRLSLIRKWRKRNAVGCNRRACRALARLDVGDRTAQVRAGHLGQRDQDRPDHRLFRAGLGLRPARQGRGRLFQVAERQGRHQRPQDQFHQPRRRLFAAQGGRECAQAGRERPGRRRVQRAGHAAQYGDPALPQPEEGAAALHRRRRHHLQRSPALSLDHGLAAQPAGRGDLLCRASAEEQTRSQGGGALPERRFRQGPAQRPDDGAGRQGQDDDRRQRRTSRRPIPRSTAR